MIRRKLRTFRQLLIDREFRCILQRLAHAVPFKIFYYNRLIILELEERKSFRKYGGATLRQAEEQDLERLALKLGRPKSEFEKRWERKDVCFFAEANGSPVSATWASFKKYQLDEVSYTFDPGSKGIFLYDAYTAPEWRLKGIHLNVMEYLLDRLAKRRVQKVYCAVEHGNTLSLRTHLRFGFKAAQYITYVKVFSLGWHFLRTPSAETRQRLFERSINVLNLKNVRK